MDADLDTLATALYARTDDLLKSVTSSNSVRMVERVREAGIRTQLVEDVRAIAALDLAGVTTVGLSSGASASERLVEEALAWFVSTHGSRVEETRVAHEDVVFHAPSRRS